jgi:hypothetical protein
MLKNLFKRKKLDTFSLKYLFNFKLNYKAKVNFSKKLKK